MKMAEILARCLLAGEIGQGLRAQRRLGGVLRLACGRDGADRPRVVIAHPGALCASSFRLSRINASSVALSPSRSGHPGDRRLRLGPAITEVDQGRQRVVGRRLRRDLRRIRNAGAVPASLRPCPAVPSAVGPPAAARPPRRVSGWPCRRRYGADQIARRQRRQDRQRDPAADSLHRREQAEPVAFGGIGEPIQDDRILPHVGLDQQFRWRRRLVAARTGCATTPAPDSRRRPRR